MLTRERELDRGLNRSSRSCVSVMGRLPRSSGGNCNLERALPRWALGSQTSRHLVDVRPSEARERETHKVSRTTK